MTDVLILKRIRGLRPGTVVPLDDSLLGHVDAGNAKILPAQHPDFEPVPNEAPEPWRASLALAPALDVDQPQDEVPPQLPDNIDEFDAAGLVGDHEYDDSDSDEDTY